MEKSTFTREYRVLCRQLQVARTSAGVTQLELAKRLKETQSEISKFERGRAPLGLDTAPAMVSRSGNCASRFCVVVRSGSVSEEVNAGQATR